MPKSFPQHPEVAPVVRTKFVVAGSRILLLATAFVTQGPALAAPPASNLDWHSTLSWGDRTATAARTPSGFHLESGETKLDIAAQPATSQTASTLLDAGFALAQEELAKSRVEQIRYNGFNNGQPFACECLVAGEQWPWVWTRDIAYATDLALFRFDPTHARNSLEFKLSGVRPASGKPAGKPASAALYPVQDTGSGGSWPVSTDRISWFLGARHLLGGTSGPSKASGSPGDAAFAAKTYKALTATLAQDRRFTFDAAHGLYRGETSFLDWREQSYPGWTKGNVVPIAASFALSTNVLYYEALQLAAALAEAHHDDAGAYRQQAAALKTAIDREFWREDRGMYMSYAGLPGAPREIEAYDLLGTSLAIISGVAPPARARRALANYPTREAGSPVIWPERQNVPIYHNRAAWPFVSAYALKAARALDEPARIAHELRSILRNAALSGSNMENYEVAPVAQSLPPGRSAPGAGGRDVSRLPVDIRAASQRASAQPKTDAANAPSAAQAPANSKVHKTHDATLPSSWKMDSNQHAKRGPVMNSRRQLWSVAAYLEAVVEGVFGVTERGTIEPKLPRELVPMLFGDGSEITLALPDRKITLVLPKQLDANDNLLVAAANAGARGDVRVPLRGTHVADSPLPLNKPFYAPDTPPPPVVTRAGEQWLVKSATTAGNQQLYVDGKPYGELAGEKTLPARAAQQCISVTTRAGDGTESLPSEPVCVGDAAAVGGAWPRSWTAERDGRYDARLEYLNRYGSVSTGITAAVKMLDVQCAGGAVQSAVLVMPHNDKQQLSTTASFGARAGQRCTFALGDGFNMSYLDKYVNYTGGHGGADGPINDAEYGELKIARHED